MRPQSVKDEIRWENISIVRAHKYVCGHCGTFGQSDHAFFGNFFLDDHDMKSKAYVYICAYCTKPTFFDFDSNQVPGPLYGNSVDHTPSDIERVYNEARRCLTISAHTASVMLSRKLLMNISVSKGAKEGLSFMEYVEFLASNNYIPPDGKDWVHHIRMKGNESNHQILPTDIKDAELLLNFSEMLLRFIYEFPKRIPPSSSQPVSNAASAAGMSSRDQSI